MLPFDFINGERRAAFASQPEAEAAANEAHRGDLRPRAVWLCSGGEACGVSVPDRFVVGIYRRNQAEPGRRVALVSIDQ